jgi:DeoR family glycerol-3-phosphate regulon repressor
MVELARLEEIDVVFTDAPPPPPFAELMAQGNVQCVVAEP